MFDDLNFDEYDLKDLNPAALVSEILRYTDNDQDVINAIYLANFCHLFQYRHSRKNFPVSTYVEHVLRNALRLLRYNVGDKNTIIATLLHDVAEDANDIILQKAGLDALDYIEKQFNATVKEIVNDVTNPSFAGDKNKAYVNHVRNIVREESFLVKLSDWIDNAGSVKYLENNNKQLMFAKKYQPLSNIFISMLNKNMKLVNSTNRSQIINAINKIDENLLKIVAAAL